MRARLLIYILICGCYLMTPQPAHAGWASQLIRQWEHVKQYVKDVYETRGGRLFFVRVKDEVAGTAEDEAYAAFFEQVSRQGPIRRGVDIALVFPRLIARLAVREPGYTFTPFRGLGRALVDKPTEKLTKAVTNTAYRPSELVKAFVYTGGSLYAIQKIILAHKDKTDNDIEQHIQKNKKIYLNFVNQDYRAHEHIRKPYLNGLISRDEALKSAWHYLETLKTYRQNLSDPLMVHEEVWNHIDNILFQDVYSYLHRRGYLSADTYEEYFMAHSKVTQSQKILSMQLQQMVFQNQLTIYGAPKETHFSKQQRDQAINDAFKAKHLLLYRDSFLDALFFDDPKADILQLYRQPSFQSYTLWSDFQQDPFVQQVFLLFEKAQKNFQLKQAAQQQATLEPPHPELEEGLEATSTKLKPVLTRADLKFILHQDFHDQYIHHLAKATNQQLNIRLEETRKNMLQIISARVGP